MKTYNERTVSILEKAKKQRRKMYITRVGICSIVTMFILAAINLAPLFKPYDTTPPSVEQYADSAHFSLIEKLNVYTYVPPKYENAFEEYILAPLQNIKWGPSGGSSSGAMNGAFDTEAPTQSYPESYEEVTDNQVSGIIEGDRIERSSQYIYYLNNQTLRIYSIAGLDSTCLGSFDIVPSDEYRLDIYADEWEMFLSQDCTTITLIASGLNKETSERKVVLISIDVTDPANIKEKTRTYLTGSYVTSRMVDDELLLISHYNAKSRGMDFSDPSTFVPQYGTSSDMKCIDPENIVVPEDLSNTHYTVICKIDSTTLEAKSTAAFLSYSEDVYVSANHIYATRTYRQQCDKNDLIYSERITEISAISYAGDTLSPAGTISVAGYVENQYSLDEYEGILRVVTTTDTDVYREVDMGSYMSKEHLRHEDNGTNASLYCIDTTSWKVVASIEKFAPQNETVQSVRFDKEAAYVCTAVTMTMTDPVFFFDLSDLNNITYKDTGTITGYSTSLIQFGEYLLGIGYGESLDDLKIELYQESEDGVVSVCSYDVANCNFSTEYKAYYIDRTNMRLGLGYFKHTSKDIQDCYVLLQFDGYEFVELIKEEIAGENDHKRAVCIDGYLYMFGTNFVVKEI